MSIIYMIYLLETNSLKHANRILTRTSCLQKSYRHCTSIYVINIIRINDKIPGNSNLLIHTRGCRVTIVTSTIYFKKWHIRYFDILCFPHNLHFHAVILLKIFLNLNYFGPRVQADPLWCVQIDFFFSLELLLNCNYRWYIHSN